MLARNSSSDDVVFGHVVTTRGLVCSSTEGLVGPCMGFIPVRVNINEGRGVASVNDDVEEQKDLGEAVEARDLLQRVQAQHLEGMPYHAHGFPNIVRECTKWPLSTRMATFVQHQNVEETPPTLLFQDGLAARAHVEARPFGSCDLSVVTTPFGAEEVDVVMNYCGYVMREDQVRMLLHALVA